MFEIASDIFLDTKPYNPDISQVQDSKIDEFVKSQKINSLSFRRKPESSVFSKFWMPDQVRHDEK
jgi:hypothetical protein